MLLAPRRENALARRTMSVAAGAVVLVVAAMVAAATFGFLFSVVWFVAKVAIIVGLVVLGLRLVLHRH